MSTLAVIIPAFKAKYLAQSLQSLADQSDKDFTVYVGDDASPDDIVSICAKFADKLNIKYARFDSNLGAVTLMKHWERCIDLSADEPWIWIFSDDDIADKHHVTAFRNALISTEEKYDIYRFDTQVIDDNNLVTFAEHPSPCIESFVDICVNTMIADKGNNLTNTIFRRSKYHDIGGLVCFPYGQSADWANIFLLSQPNNIYTIPHIRFSWRSSPIGISQKAAKNREKTVIGFFEFIEWLHNTILPTIVLNRDYYRIYDASFKCLIRTLVFHYRGISFRSYTDFRRVTQRCFGLLSIEVAYWFCFINTRNFLWLIRSFVRRWLTRQSASLLPPPKVRRLSA
jgi:glycosyltransferase involved in cell wall biosynthesis